MKRSELLNKINDGFAAMYGGEFVPGCGKEDASVMLIGEAPGKDEVREGIPFVGKAGKNLDEFLSYTGLERDDIYITNAVKTRPVRISAKGTVSNRPPTNRELLAARELLLSEIAAVSPGVIVTLGNTPLRSVTGDMKASIGGVHGRPVLTEAGLTVFPLYHPASIIYNRALKETYMRDLDALKAFIESM